MNRTRLFALLTIIILLTSLFAGCGSTTVKKDDMKEPVELSYYFLSYGEIKDLPLIETKINEYLKPKINATIKLMPIADADYNQKLMTMASAGEPMDLVFTSFWAYPFIKAVNTGQLMALNELLDQYGPEVKKNEYPEYWPAVTVNGNIYAVPINGGIAYQQAYTFNKTLVEKDATDLIDELSKVKSRNMFLELENTDLSKLKDEQELNLENMKNSLTKAEGLVIGKENEANELRTQNDFLGKNLATKNKENEKLVKEAATANVYKHAIWWAIGLFLLYTILKNVLMIYFPAIRFRV